MAKSGTEKVHHQRGHARYSDDATLSGGAGTLTFDPVPLGFELHVHMIAVAATDVTSQPAGMVAAAYVDSPSIPEALIGWDMIVSPAPGSVLEPNATPFVIRAGERVVVTISSAGSSPSVRGRLSGTLMEVEDRDWPAPAPVQITSWADPQIVEPTVWADRTAEG